MDDSLPDLVTTTVHSADFYLQVIAIAVTAMVSWLLSRIVKRKIIQISEDEERPQQGMIKSRVESATYHLRELIFPVTNAILLGVAVAVSREFFAQQWLVQFVQGVNFLSVTYIAATRISTSPSVRYFSLLVLSPLIILYAIGLLDNMVAVAEEISFNLGNIPVSYTHLTLPTICSV